MSKNNKIRYLMGIDAGLTNIKIVIFPKFPGKLVT